MPPGGAIINISSKASTHPSPFTVVYAAAKAGLNALTAAAAQEYGPRGIRVNGIICGTFDTDSLRSSLPSEQAAVEAASRVSVRAHRPRRRDRRRCTVSGQRRLVVRERRDDRAGRRLMLPIPRLAADIDPAWLNEALQRALSRRARHRRRSRSNGTNSPMPTPGSGSRTTGPSSAPRDDVRQAAADRAGAARHHHRDRHGAAGGAASTRTSRPSSRSAFPSRTPPSPTTTGISRSCSRI